MKDSKSPKTATLYLFSGLGADERAFHRLDFGNTPIRYIQWISPEENESLEHYAGRLIPQITTTEPILIGLSFGGVMALEVAKQIPVKTVILLASIKNKYEIPGSYRFASRLGLNNLIPVRLLKKANWFTFWVFGAHSKEDKALLRQILKDTDTTFLKWALTQLPNWQNTSIPTQIIHIHGTHDHVLPFRSVKNTIPIKHGGHFMTLNKAKEISKLMQQHI